MPHRRIAWESVMCFSQIVASRRMRYRSREKDEILAPRPLVLPHRGPERSDLLRRSKAQRKREAQLSLPGLIQLAPKEAPASRRAMAWVTVVALPCGYSEVHRHPAHRPEDCLSRRLCFPIRVHRSAAFPSRKAALSWITSLILVAIAIGAQL
jgi:hypothetical protein